MEKKGKTAEESLKDHYKNEFLIFLRNFIECYLIPGVKFEEIYEVIYEYRNRETEEMITGLLREAELIREKKDWEFIRMFVKKHGMRGLSNNKPQILIDSLIEGLAKKSEN